MAVRIDWKRKGSLGISAGLGVLILLLLYPVLNRMALGEKTMAVLPVKTIYTAAHLTGFWQFSAGEDHFLCILEKDEEETRSTFSILKAAEGCWETLKTISDEDVSIRAIDGAPSGPDLVFGIETNQDAAVEISRVDLSALLDRKNKQVSFKPEAEINLPQAQAQKVKLPPAKWWSTPTLNAPSKWLFNPRFVKGGRANEMTLNTADGQALILNSADKTAPPLFALPNAAEPQAVADGSHFTVSFKRYPEPYYPYWSLPRYSGDSQPRPGELFVCTDPASSRNLSHELAIGPVIGYHMTALPKGPPWIFVLIDVPVGTDIVALSKGEKAWAIEGRWSIDAEVSEISAGYAGAKHWHLIYGAPSAKGWSLAHQVWQSK